jgi:hypothetical protein
MIREKIYLGHDNVIDVILREDNVPIDTTALTTITLTFGSYLVSSTNQAGDAIRWLQTGYSVGQVKITLGADGTLTAGVYDVPLIVYSNDYTTGLVWGYLNIEVIAEVEGT